MKLAGIKCDRTAMTTESLLTQLGGVRETGHGKYVARCPAHDDKSPSLAIKDCGDGRVLLHCFAGCETQDVLIAIGLTFADLMPDRIGDEHSYKPVRQRFDARQVLAALDHEALVVAIIGADFLEHKEIDVPTWSRLAQGVHRINLARAQATPLRHRK